MTAKQMVSILSEALSKNAGVAEVVIDGQKIRYDRKQLLEELTFWERKAAGGRRYINNNLSGGTSD